MQLIWRLILNTYDNAYTVKLHTNGRYSCGNNAMVKEDMFVYTGGHRVRGKETGTVRILEPMNSTLNYFEYKIISRGAECEIGIGVGEADYPLDRMPGWNQNGVGYHADDGHLYYQRGYGRAFGPLCTVGDRMGCGIDFASEDSMGNIKVFFTKNGKQVGDLVRIKKPPTGLYPLVGMCSKGEQVQYLGHWHRLPQDSKQQTTSSNGELLHRVAGS